jgi:hypothetical protein
MLKRVILWAMLTSLAGAAGAQMSLPQLGSGLGTALGRVDSALSPVTRPVEGFCAMPRRWPRRGWTG